MKKSFLLLISLLVVCFSASAELYADDAIVSEEIVTEISNSIAPNFDWVITPVDSVTLENATKQIQFKQVLWAKNMAEDGEHSITNDKKICLGVLIDDAWVLATHKCHLSIGDETLPYNGNVVDVEYSNFKVDRSDGGVTFIGARHYETSDGKFLLLNVVNENGNPYFAAVKKVNLVQSPYNRDMDGLKLEVKVNRTKVHKAEYKDSTIEENFTPYALSRDIHNQLLTAVKVNDGTISGYISTNGLRERAIRAGDPVFLRNQINNNTYLLGLGDAVNLPDNGPYDTHKPSRSHKITMFSQQDLNNIISTIRTQDPAAAERVSNNILSLNSIR